MSGRRLPWVTLAVAGAAIVVHLVPAAGEWLVYDRARVDAGEAWRIVTGSVVHFSTSHLALDVAAVGGAGVLVERRGRMRFALLCLAALAAVGIAVHLLAPGLARYAGLSGVAFAVLATCALDMYAEHGAMRRVGMGLLGILAAKLAADLLRPTPLLLDGDAGVVAAPVSHVAGIAVGIAVAAAGAMLGRVRRASIPARHAGRLAAMVLVLVALTACMPPTERLRHGAPVAPVVLRHATRAADDAAPRSAPRRLGVAVASESMTGRSGGVFGRMDGPTVLTASERDGIARRIAAMLRQQPALRGSEIVVLPAGAEQLGRDELATRHGIDALCMVGYDQVRRTSNGRLLLLEVGLLLPPFVLPTLRSEASTMVDVVAVRLRDGRMLFRGGAASRVRGRAVPMYAGSHAHDLRVRGLHEAVAALGAELPSMLAELDDTASAARP